MWLDAGACRRLVLQDTTAIYEVVAKVILLSPKLGAKPFGR